MRDPREDTGIDVHEHFWPHVLVEAGGPGGDLGDREFSGTKIGLMTCRKCGAAVMLYPTVNALQLHIDWHYRQSESPPPEDERRRIKALQQLQGLVAEAQEQDDEARDELIDDLKLAVNLINEYDELDGPDSLESTRVFGELLALRDKYAHLVDT